MDASRFCQELCSVMPESWKGFRLKEGASAWTAYMARKVFELARKNDLGVCSHVGNCAPPGFEDATKVTGWAREFLFDFTLYHNWSNFSEPVVIIEHENNWNTGAFMADFWKLLLGYAPLRVMIGYQRTAGRVREYFDAIRSNAARERWRYPADTEDLVLVGHERMAPQGFHVLRRSMGSREWCDCGLLAIFTKRKK